LQRFETKKIDGLVVDFETRFGLTLLWLTETAARRILMRRCDLRRLLRIE